MGESKTKVISVERTCRACPSQWEGVTDDRRLIYVRYRYGVLRIAISDPGATDIHAAVNGEELFCLEWGDPFGGDMSYSELIALTADHVEWPESDDCEKHPGVGAINA